eukprot:15484024-Alexandrium_andersonii.AAC.1
MLQAANTLIECGQGHGSFDQEIACLKVLVARLPIQAQVPTALGSGRANIFAKTHALIHACRMICPSWLACVRVLNSVVSFTGDLGPESRLPAVHVDLSRFFGPWVVESDADARARAEGSGEGLEAPDSEAAADELEFDVQADDAAQQASALLHTTGASAAAPRLGGEYEVSFLSLIHI